MTTFYDHQKLEQKWQKKWQQEKFNLADDKSKKPKKYILDMYPYPSGEGLHVGHVESYTATDIVSRFLRMRGYNVLHPQGFDAFGLPAENYAIKTGVHPQETTGKAMESYKRQLNSLGMSYDWSREVVTSDPNYYKWTQWLFLQLYKKGLAYKKKAPVNWCESCKTVLANEQVVDGKCERCGQEVMQKDLEQWFFKITDYAPELLQKIDEMDWPDALKHAQRNWIGKSEGALIKFAIQDTSYKPAPLRGARPGIQKNSKSQIPNSKLYIEVFTTRPDTLFGATYLVVAPEHPLVKDLGLSLPAGKAGIKNYDEVQKYVDKAQKKNKLERIDLAKEKTGVELKGVTAINPATKKEIPIWIADYVMMDYGTGAIMAVPAHDERDLRFADKYGLEITYVIDPQDKYDLDKYVPLMAAINGDDLRAFKYQYDQIRKGVASGLFAYTGEGVLINSEKFNGLKSEEARDKITKFVGGQKQTQYKIRDWLVSRQRYWGAPIPIIYCRKCWENSKSQIPRNKQKSNNQNTKIQTDILDGLEYALIPVLEKDLPVKLPTDVDFKPTGESPLASSKIFHKVKCPKCGAPARRESDTMDTFVCSSWYFLRYADPKNQKEIFSKELIKKWLPVDLYIGGMEHAVGHLMYARFITKVLRDLKYLDFDEPFLRIKNQGIILAEDSRKMSKRWGNVINPDDVVEEYGADTLRIYEMFMGPLEDAKPWSQQGIIGVRRFLEKINKFVENSKVKGKKSKVQVKSQNFEVERLLHKTIKKVTEDIENLHFNTAISTMMILINKITNNQLPITKNVLERFLIILSPFAPHLTEELWESLSHKESIFKQRWPEYDKKLVIDEEVTIAIQVNGKLRDTIKVERGVSESEIKSRVNKLPKIKKHIEGKKIKRFIYIQDKLVNIVIYT